MNRADPLPDLPPKQGTAVASGAARDVRRKRARKRMRAMQRAPLFGFAGRLGRRAYVTTQTFSALLFIMAIAFMLMSIRVPDPVAGLPYSPRIEFAGWALGGALGAMAASMLIGTGAVMRRARDGALPAIFIGLFYVINRLLLPVNIGHLGPPTVREMALHLAFIMLVVQILLLVRGTVRSRTKRARAKEASVTKEPADPLA